MIYTLENDNLRISVASLGATLIHLIDKTTNIDLVLGFDHEEDYLKHKDLYLGATIGRCANRLEKGQFKLNDHLYQVTINSEPHSLHGGKGISYEEFTLLEQTNHSLTLQRVLENLEDGYPGKLILTIKYELVDNKVLYSINGLTDEDTIFNVTSHPYFNLNNEDTILNHQLQIYTNQVSLNDSTEMAKEESIDVSNTCFDFRELKKIEDNLSLGHENLSNGGLNHNYIFENMNKKKMCTLKSEQIQLDLYSDLPCLHVYTANYFDTIQGKNHRIYKKYSGIALEPQYYPNAINYSHYIKPILKANEEVNHFIEYVITPLDNS